MLAAPRYLKTWLLAAFDTRSVSCPSRWAESSSTNGWCFPSYGGACSDTDTLTIPSTGENSCTARCVECTPRNGSRADGVQGPEGTRGILIQHQPDEEHDLVVYYVHGLWR